MMSLDEIFASLRPLLADSLALKQDQIALESRLIDDLGADSLDFIDIIFGLEKKFGIKMRDGELDFLTRLDFSSPEVMRHGFVTPQTVEKLQTWLPDLALAPDPSKITPAQIFSCIKVRTLCELIERRLSNK
jgi:acyl carrier protein